MTASEETTPRIPAATYRIQLGPGFGFEEAAELAPYLAELGVSHLYTSPVLQAAPGSSHGYDVADPTRPSAELGGSDGHTRLSQALAEAGLGHVLDIVPNHMAVGGPENPWWWDVLENGPGSRYADFFDIDWDSPDPALRHTVLVPILAEDYATAIEGGQLALERHEAGIRVRYTDVLLPIAPRSLGAILTRAADGLGSDQPRAARLRALVGDLERLPAAVPLDRDRAGARHREQTAMQARLADLCRDQVVARAVDKAIAEVNADRAALDTVLQRQSYRLACWRVAAQKINYRRFFDVNSLAGIRVEDPGVFAATHRLVVTWVRTGVVDGLRVDHVDGLRDPHAYLERLADASHGAWTVVEKILQPGERLRERWPVAGTTGYDVSAGVTGLFLDPAGEAPLSELWAEVAGSAEPFAEVAHRAKHLVIGTSLAADVARLTASFHDGHSEADRAAAIEEVLACFPVCRTYVTERDPAHPDDVASVRTAVAEARGRRPDLDPVLIDRLGRILLAEDRDDTDLRLRFPQVAATVMAKGVEDTALYAYHRMTARNEVGDDPSRWATPVGVFHAANQARRRQWPAAMVTTSTHDTKRSEDVRARLVLLSEMPRRWRQAWGAWRARNTRHRPARLDPPSEYLLYQTLVGAWPLSPDRAVAYLLKAAREAKVRTSWTDPDQEYEEALERFVRDVLGDGAFVTEVEQFVAEEVLEAGWVNSLSGTLLKLTVPGVPDIYQGCELWDLSLVDPDNRRPVDFARRRRLLAGLGSVRVEECWDRAVEGLPKLLVTHRALALRRCHPEWLGVEAPYRPLATEGPSAGHVVAFARSESVVTVVPRLVWQLGRRPEAIAGALRGTDVMLPEGTWRNVLVGERVPGGVADAGLLLARFPVALLAREA